MVFNKKYKNSYLYSGKEPIFEDKEIFRVTIPLLRNEEQITIDNRYDTLNDTLNLIKKDKNITVRELSKRIKKSESTIKRYLSELKNKGYIKRVGSDKTGYWQILK